MNTGSVSIDVRSTTSRLIQTAILASMFLSITPVAYGHGVIKQPHLLEPVGTTSNLHIGLA